MRTPEPCRFERGCGWVLACAKKGYCRRRQLDHAISPSQECSWRIDAAIANCNARTKARRDALEALVHGLLARPESERDDVWGELARAYLKEQSKADTRQAVAGG